MAWLGTWENRIKLSVSNSNVDATLSNFPIQVYLSAASGIGDVDVSAIFDEIASDANRKKIAVTTSDGTTQCNVEIERWDDASEKAWLWVKVPSILASAETILYIYYDSAQADNTTYIGDIGDIPAQGVWDSNFEGVWHMAQDPNGDPANAIKDSTSTANHGTPAGSMTTADLVDGKIGKAIDLDGVDDRIIIPDSAGLRGMAAITIELSLKVTTKGAWEKILDYSGAAAQNADRKYRFQFDNSADNGLTFVLWDSANASIGFATTIAFPTSNFCYVAGVYTGENVSDSVKIYKNGSQDATGAGTGNAVNNTIAGDFWLGGEQWTPPRNPYDGSQDEIRVSGIERPAAWLKATYHSNEDNLITFEHAIQASATIPMMMALAGTGIAAETTVPMMTAAATLSSDLQTITANASIPMMEAELSRGPIGDINTIVPMMTAEIREAIPGEHWNADATVPMMTAELSRGPVGNIENVTVPMMTAEATFGARCEAAVPMMEMDTEVTVGRVVRGEATVPMMTAELYGVTEHLTNADAAIPMMKASAYLYSGKIIRGDATIPMMAAEITAYQDIDGDINATIPMMTAEISGSPDRATCEILRYLDP